jgi:peptidoglycan/LPS O-acetylase OafA/YrhL
MPTAAVLAIGVAGSFLAAHLYCIAIEEPSTKLGRQLTRSRKRVVSS